MALRQVPESLVVARLGEDDADIRQRRLDQHAGDVALRELVLEPVHVVDLDCSGRDRRLNRRSDRVGAEPEGAFFEDDERLIHRAVVAPGVHEHLRPACYLAREADREPVRVSGGQRELPRRQSEAAGQLLAAPDRVLAGEHDGDAATDLFPDRVRHGRRRVPCHRAGVPEAKVDVLVTVHIHEASPSGLLDEDGVGPGPFGHPVHRDARQQRSPGALEELARARVLVQEACRLPFPELA